MGKHKTVFDPVKIELSSATLTSARLREDQYNLDLIQYGEIHGVSFDKDFSAFVAGVPTSAVAATGVYQFEVEVLQRFSRHGHKSVRRN